MTTPTRPADNATTPTPSALFGAMLQPIDDLLTLKCALRAVWHIDQKRGELRFVTKEALLEDSVLLADADPDAVDEAAERALALAVRLGVFAKGAALSDGEAVTVYVVNTPQQRQALRKAQQAARQGNASLERTGPSPPLRPTIFELYEQEIGILTALVAEELTAATEEYTEPAVEQAIMEASRSDKRSWRYAAAILRNWRREGRIGGEPGRDTKAADPNRYLEEYVRRRGKLPWS